MKRSTGVFNTIIIFLIITSTSLSFAYSSASAAVSEQETAQRLFSLMDLEQTAMEDIKLSYNNGNYSTALSLFRDMIVMRLRSLDFNEFPWHTAYNVSYNIANAKLWAGKMTIEDFNTEYADSLKGEYYWNISGLPSEPFEPDWLALPPDGVVPDYLWFRWFTSFVAAYNQSGDSDYLLKWFQINNDYALNHKNIMQNAYINGQLSSSDIRNWRMQNNFVFHMAFRSDFMIRQLASICKALPAVNGSKPNWSNILKPNSSEPSLEAIELIPPIELANIIIALTQDHIPYLVEWYVNRTGAVPNQRFTGLQDLAIMGIVFKEFNNIKEVVVPSAEIGFADHFARTQYPDGGMLEQAFNYNSGEYNSMQKLLLLFNSADSYPSYVSLVERNTYRLGRLFNSLKRPIGGLPSVGFGGIDQSIPIWQSDIEVQNWKKKSIYDVVPQNGYNSIGFPYAGYYAMRSGWDILDTYLFMQSPRRSRGHLYPSNGSIELMFKGRHLLMAGGAPWYSTTDCPEELLPEFSRFNQYFGESSSFNRNTVIVNGMSQLKENIITDAKDQPVLPHLWHASSFFDIAESIWSGGYGDSTQKIYDVIHDRKVIYVKDADFFVVTDEMSGNIEGKTHNQIWNFLPKLEKSATLKTDVYGYSVTDIVYRENEKTIYTNQINSPNLYIKQFTTENLNYNLYYGHRPLDGQYYGWYSPGISGMRYPKPDIHVGFSGSKPLVTTLIPVDGTQTPISNVQDLSNIDVSGFYFMKDTKHIKFLTSKNNSLKVTDNITVNAKTLLVISEGDVKRGIALECSSLNIDGQEIPILTGNFEFKLKDNGVQFYEISQPETFSWDETNEITPKYYSKEIFASDFSFKKEGVEIIGHIPSGEVKCSATISNRASIEKPYTMIAACYKDSKLVNIGVVSSSLAAGEIKKQKISINVPYEGCLVKIMVWNSINEMESF